MVLKLLRSISVVLSVGALGTPSALAATPATDEAVVAAFEAYRAGDAIKFSKHAKKLDGHVLAPWLEYWRLSFGLEDASPADVAAFFRQHGNTFVAERLRTDWLKILGKRGAWQQFDLEAAQLPRDDLETRCYKLGSRLQRGDEEALKDAALVWLEPRDLPEGCARLADRLAERGVLSVTDVWQRVRILFQAGQTTAAKQALG